MKRGKFNQHIRNIYKYILLSGDYIIFEDNKFYLLISDMKMPYAILEV